MRGSSGRCLPRAWRHAHLYDESRGTVLVWLLLLTRVASIDRVRARRERAAELPAEIFDPFSTRETSRGQDTAVQLRVRSALERLPGPEREVLTLAFYEGLTLPELADCLSTPLDIVTTRARNGLRRLREHLKEPQ